MQSSSRRGRAKLHLLGPGILPVASASLAGCSYFEAKYAQEDFCGIFYYCGSHSDTNRGGGQTASGESSDSSDESTAPIGAD